ncbi:MAG TPA: M12 family metallo-peptidase [Vicinamibacteria bacterium]|nr:M12 family metallo-peptidase [Vicinamibacteria bacterium]
MPIGLLPAATVLALSAAAPPITIPATSSDLAARARRVAVGSSFTLTDLALDTALPKAALELTRFEVFAPDAKIVVHREKGEEILPAPANAYFRGRLAGDPDSTAILTVRAQGGVRGLLAQSGRVWVMESGGEGRLAAAAIDFARDVAERDFSCATDHLSDPRESVPGADPQGIKPSIPEWAPATHTARIAIESDNEFLAKFGGNTTNATDYIGDLFAYSSTIYERDLRTTMVVSSVSLWVSTDPWAETSTSCGLFEFGRYWNNNNGGISRTVAHFLSGKSNGGGVAWVGVLCSGAFNYTVSGCSTISGTSNFGGGYGYSGDMDGNFNINNPAIVWDIEVVSHEIGHNFNSPHSHCYANIDGNANPVDACYAGQCGSTGCYCGGTSLPGLNSLTGGTSGGRNGTIMSYCHLLSGGLPNIALTFGTEHKYGIAASRVPTRMYSHVTGVAAGNPSCLAYQAGSSDIIFRDGFQ